jgi:hypothetical protein
VDLIRPLASVGSCFIDRPYGAASPEASHRAYPALGLLDTKMIERNPKKKKGPYIPGLKRRGFTARKVNKRRIRRDSTGRIYQERRLLVPKNGKAESVMIQISDPNAHTHYNCFVLEEPHVCVLTMLSIRSDPRFGKQTFAATNLILSEPDPKLFELPEGCRVEDRRSSSPPEVN